MRRTLVVLRTEPSLAADPAPVPARGWRFPRPTPSGLLFAGALAAAVVGIGMVAGALPVGEYGAVLVPWRAGVPAVLFLAVQGAATAWWRSAPLAAFSVSTVAAVAAAGWGGSSLVLDMSWFVLSWRVAVSTGPLRAAALLAAGQVLLVPASLGAGPFQPSPLITPDDAALLVGSSVSTTALLWAAGWAWRVVSARRAAARARTDGDRTRELVTRERHRVARELHDVIAHLVSAVAVQAGAARAVAGHDPGTAREAVRHVEEHGARIREALPQLITLAPVGEIVPLTREGVERLLEPVRAAGVPVTAHVVGEPATDGETGLFAQRILTEALTNTLRHAGRSPTRVVVDHGVDAVTVAVVDGGPAPAAGPHIGGAGLGLVGMRERVRLLGGRLVAGPTPTGGWSVEARLPLAPLPREEEGARRTARDGDRPRAEVAGPAAS